MVKRKWKVLAASIALVVAALSLSACSTQTTTDDCGLVIGNGAHEAHALKKVIYPGDSVGHQGNDWVKFIPCGPRNYVVTADTSHGDRHDPAIGTTGKGTDGTPGVGVNVYFSMYWTVNEQFTQLSGGDKAGSGALAEFWIMCQKYTCASDKQNDNSDNNSTPGWNSMLREVMSDAANRAIADALLQEPQDIYWNRAEWPDLATKAEDHILTEEKASTNTTADMFCATTSDTKNGKECKPPTFTIESVAPQDPTLTTIRNNQVSQQASAANNAARIANAKALYGPDWYKFLETQDTITACKAAGQNCTIVIGNSPLAVGSGAK